MVEYFTFPEIPDRTMFKCERLRASLAVSACANMWQEANADGEQAERLFRCRLCPLGAQHAGATNASMSPLRGTSTCARCQRRDMRLIGKNICIGCYNRQREYLKGVNAKGKFPAQHPRLDRRRVRFVAGGVCKAIVREHAAKTEELVVELLRDCKDQVVFGAGVFGAPGLRQGRLMEAMGSREAIA